MVETGAAVARPRARGRARLASAPASQLPAPMVGEGALVVPVVAAVGGGGEAPRRAPRRRPPMRSAPAAPNAPARARARAGGRARDHDETTWWSGRAPGVAAGRRVFVASSHARPNCRTSGHRIIVPHAAGARARAARRPTGAAAERAGRERPGRAAGARRGRARATARRRPGPGTTPPPPPWHRGGQAATQRQPTSTRRPSSRGRRLQLPPFPLQCAPARYSPDQLPPPAATRRFTVARPRHPQPPPLRRSPTCARPTPRPPTRPWSPPSPPGR